MRPTRVVQGAGGLLPRYSGRDADGQELLNTVTDRHPDERYVRRPTESHAAAVAAVCCWLLLPVTQTAPRNEQCSLAVIVCTSLN